MVSVLGIGGTGKTRLALRLAHQSFAEWPGGAWFCDLSEARSLDGIAHGVARALDVSLGKDDPVVQGIGGMILQAVNNRFVNVQAHQVQRR